MPLQHVIQLLCLLENNLKGLVIKCGRGRETVHEGITVVGGEHTDFKRFKSQIVGI